MIPNQYSQVKVGWINGHAILEAWNRLEGDLYDAVRNEKIHPFREDGSPLEIDPSWTAPGFYGESPSPASLHAWLLGAFYRLENVLDHFPLDEIVNSKDTETILRSLPRDARDKIEQELGSDESRHAEEQETWNKYIKPRVEEHGLPYKYKAFPGRPGMTPWELALSRPERSGHFVSAHYRIQEILDQAEKLGPLLALKNCRAEVLGEVLDAVFRDQRLSDFLEQLASKPLQGPRSSREKTPLGQPKKGRNKRHDLAKEHGKLALAKAQQLWRKKAYKNYTVPQMARCDEIQNLFGGYVWAESTVEDWIRPANPNKEPGRRPDPK